MNNDITTAFLNAVLSDASYVDGLTRGMTEDALATELRKRLTEPLAIYIANRFEVVTQYTEGNWAGSGFSATVWKNRSTGQIYMSFRGTEGAADFITDIDLAAGSGIARAQELTMINWYLRATTPVGQDVKQMREALGVFVTNSATASGELYEIRNATMIANGHSLGGHLATAFVRLFPGAVSASNTFNGAGFIPSSEDTFRKIEEALGFPQGAFPGPAKQKNYFAEHGINVTTNDWWFNQFGQRIPLFNEEGTTVPNHLMYKLTDTLALCDVLGMIDGSLSLADATVILDAASSEPAASLEALLDALRKLYWKVDDPTPVGDAGDSAATRVAFHENLAFLRGMIADGTLPGGQIVSLAGRSPAEVAAQATEEGDAGLAARYALKALNPFILVGADYGLHNRNGELDLYDEAADTGTLSDNWLLDRAAMLAAKVAVNTSDNNLASPGYFKDISSNTVLGGNLFGLSRRTVFGGEGADGLEGGANADRLYGGAGEDALRGHGGADHLEGGAGEDALFGGSGDDLLAGGAGDDRLRGGAGFDTYRVGGNGGTDVIVDFADKGALAGLAALFSNTDEAGDGLGEIVHAGEALGGGLIAVAGEPQRWRDARGRDYRLTGAWGGRGLLHITDPAAGGAIRLMGWKNGELGIVLPAPAAVAKGAKSGDEEDNHLAADSAEQRVFGLGGDDRIAVSLSGAEGWGCEGADRIYGGAGDDACVDAATADLPARDKSQSPRYGGDTATNDSAWWRAA